MKLLGFVTLHLLITLTFPNRMREAEFCKYRIRAIASNTGVRRFIKRFLIADRVCMSQTRQRV